VDNFRIKMKKTKSERTDKPFSGSSINKMVSLARRIYYLAMDAGMVKSNPFARRGTFKEEPKGHYISCREKMGMQNRQHQNKKGQRDVYMRFIPLPFNSEIVPGERLLPMYFLRLFWLI